VARERADHLETEVQSAMEAATATEHAVGEANPSGTETSPLARKFQEALNAMRDSIDTLSVVADEYMRFRDERLASGPLDTDEAERINEEVRLASLALTSDAGLPGEAWSRQLLFASDPDNGYSTLALPAVRLALRAGDLGLAADRIQELAVHLGLVAEHLRSASGMLGKGMEGE
jgi:hypothetical protein